MSYENAPATTMLATHCAICNRPLVDSVSVETGIGPICREDRGYNVDVPETDREQANKLVHEVACMMGNQIPKDAKRLQEICQTLSTLGFSKLAGILIERNTVIKIHAKGQYLHVESPYRPDYIEAFKQGQRAVNSRAHWDRESKAWIVFSSPDARKALWASLRAYFPGQMALGPKGPFVIA